MKHHYHLYPIKMKKEFKNERFNELCEFMEKMDKSDDYIFLQVSSLKPCKGDMELDILLTGGSGGKPDINRAEAKAVLIVAMKKNDDLKRLLTDAVMHYEMLQAFKGRRQS